MGILEYLDKKELGVVDKSITREAFHKSTHYAYENVAKSPQN